MMINPCPDTQKDTVTGKKVVFQDTFRLKSDSTLTVKPFQTKDSLHNRLFPVEKINTIDLADTTSICCRNSIADITFYDSNNFIVKIRAGSSDMFPFIFTEKTRQIQDEARVILLKHLKPGSDIPVQPLHHDWVLIVILIVAFLFSIIRTTSKNVLPGIFRFFLFRGISDPASRDIGGLFHWQSTILNLISFLVIGLFAFFTATYYNFIPARVTGIIFWLISSGIIIIAVTLRHVICVITGNASGEKEVFKEYLVAVYQSYRFSALFLFIIIILMSYTVIFPVRFCFISGITLFGLMYLIRIIRLFVIFINRNISIFYLILYLCALEILPVVISVKYITGLA